MSRPGGQRTLPCSLRRLPSSTSSFSPIWQIRVALMLLSVSAAAPARSVCQEQAKGAPVTTVTSGKTKGARIGLGQAGRYRDEGRRVRRRRSPGYGRSHVAGCSVNRACQMAFM